MKFKSNKTKITFLVILTLVITLLSSCNRNEKEAEATTNDETPIVSPVEKTENTPSSNTDDESISEDSIEVFDDSELGYSVQDDKLFLNDRALPAGKIAETKKEADRTTYQFYDGAALIIKSNGDIIVNFPIQITLLIDKDFKTFKTLYKGNPLTNATIYDFITADNWYTIDYGDGTSLKFNNNEMIFTTNNLEIIQSKDSSETIFKDIVISTSNIKTTDALTSIIRIEYEDGNQLTHIIGGSTTFIFKTGTSIESDGETTTIKKDEKTTVITGEIKGINYDMETGEIELETTEENVKFDTAGTIIEQTSLIAEEEIIPEEETITSEEELIDSEEVLSEEEAQDEILDELPLVDEDFEQDTIGEWDQEETVNPFRIGVLANFTFLQKDSKYSEYGLRGDFIVENEVVDGIVIGLQIGVGADHFASDGSNPVGFYKQLTTYATFSQEFTPNYSNTSYFYKFGLGSLIPLDEGDTETPYFKLALSAGVNFNIDPHWMLRVGAEFALNYRTELAMSESAYVGLFYKFK